jgi:hypothetical protein
MHKSTSRKIAIFLTGFILLTWFTILPSSLSAAGLRELSDGELAAVYGYGFSTFTLNGDIVKLDFSGVSLSTYTDISSMKLGYYTKGTLGWDNDWTGVKLGTPTTDLVATGLYIEAGFSNINNPATRQLEYFRIGTPNMMGTISANFNSFSGTLDNGITTYTRDTTFGAAAITSSGGGFNLTLSRNGVGNQMGYSFNWVSGTHL